MTKQIEVPDTTTLPAEVRAGMLEEQKSMFMNVALFEHGLRVATMFSKSTMIPEHFKGNVGNCMIALNMAERFGVDIFMMMQNIYVIGGKPGLEGKLVIALINQCGKFTPLQYKFEKDSKGKVIACTAFATHKETREKLEQTVTWEMVQAEGWDKKPGSKWKTIPTLMFQYRSATFFARTYCPEVILGMQTTDEIFDFVDMKKTDNGSYQVSEAGETAFDTSEFDRLVSEKIDYPDTILDKFLEQTAKAQDITVNELKAEAAMAFDNFWTAFEQWRKKEYPPLFIEKDEADSSDKNAHAEKAAVLCEAISQTENINHLDNWKNKHQHEIDALDEKNSDVVTRAIDAREKYFGETNDKKNTDAEGKKLIKANKTFDAIRQKDLENFDKARVSAGIKGSHIASLEDFDRFLVCYGELKESQN
jgi:hypothetical protein